jgi:hypothetical protein
VGILTLLGWLQHVAQNIQKSPTFAGNPVWVRRNLVAVVRGALPLLDGATAVEPSPRPDGAGTGQ